MKIEHAMYPFARGERGLFVEVYFPKKVEFQARIFNTLKNGRDAKLVKAYFKKHARKLLTELALYPNLFDPDWYNTHPTERVEIRKPTVARARRRFDAYVSQFQGWSMNEVDGMFFKGEKVYEERTQVIRLIFRFKSRYSKAAERESCNDVLRSILYYAITARGLISGEAVWDDAHKAQYMANHAPWVDDAKREFAEKHFAAIARETIKWTDNCALFIFAYLVREFSQEVLKTGKLEEEIWVMSLFGVTLNVIKKSKTKVAITERKEIL
ncbi:MAG: hypothetical protein A3B25_00715 [Candidatus Ryanbacteria bacterium RIFCSPLOWO2_01_FULL_48_26]|uniref:Uncharacterized protein n=1 Tax=Candidatus Ryanbacteria bacterium RIFCSPLOWO2_01_FULL_48_26 TaxID=1802126 RepID=A0A1G2GW57_9BACT|nr:MAG: hypothetical protein A3B25_00715 [Candidatus Ryanbacteria bacterium RIFCSPLOWO2_01_FULL_48_26]